MRGEKNLLSGAGDPEAGSPPHARGKALTLAAVGSKAGITPACAGKSGFVMLRRGSGEDHPRMRGEKIKQT